MGSPGRRIAHFLQEVEVAEGVAGLGVRGVLEEARDVREALDVRDAREVEVAAVRLRLAREGVLQVVHALAALERLACHGDSSCRLSGGGGSGAGARRATARGAGSAPGPRRGAGTRDSGRRTRCDGG